MRTLVTPALALAAAALLGLAGCDNMQHQENVRPFEPSPGTPDGSSARIPPAHTVDRGAPAPEEASGDSVGLGIPVPLSPAFVRRGGERYGIFCADCHGAAGEGDGIVVLRGFPRPRSFDDPSVRRESSRRLFDAVGTGVMYGFADRITPADRWAIVAYVRALERSRNASVRDVPEAERGRLEHR
jgi:hypothetical protein